LSALPGNQSGCFTSNIRIDTRSSIGAVTLNLVLHQSTILMKAALIFITYSMGNIEP